MEELGFVQRHAALGAAGENIALQPPARLLQLFARAEQAGVAGHVEHLHEPDAPGVGLRLAVPRFLPEDPSAAVHLARDLHVFLHTEDGARARVGVEQGDVFGGQGEAPLGFAQVLDAAQEKSELRRGAGKRRAGQRQQAELDETADIRKYFLTVLEVVEADQPLLAGDFVEERLGRIIGGDAAGRDQSRASPRVEQPEKCFRKQ